ncbi:electron transport complex subunit RsxC [Avibacterium sp. 20-15]|uniref:electron transport complex subunit RsxC n=1 Tax=unclassified Avibacterium TaxID=2685287 RepID=UPI002026B72F|nr:MULTISPECIES: electron transport complex subunit RsxC [unclassified Avibacterium]MCW9734140.1 electron transport complex subunit RsxC [Avibacterium sp. 20-15]URL03779.1 electron transport complex subunit RsxC [Avibacterium sp. 20-132]
MADVLTHFNSGRLWDFAGGIHPPEMKSQSNHVPIRPAALVETYYVPVKQHAGNAGNLLVKEGDKVLKGQPLTLGEGLRNLPVHAPTSGIVTAITPYIAAHPSGLPELTIQIQADGKDQWRTQHPIEDFLTQTPEQLIEKIYHAGIAGLGGAVFPTAAKIQSAENKVKLLIINGAECEPYITCDDRLMQDYPNEIIEGIRILRYILSPEKVVIAIEDNKPNAVKALKHALKGANDIEIRVIPTKYPSGAAKQLIQVLTGIEVPSGQRSSSIGVLMHNVGTAFAIKRAVINDEPLIERVVTLTGDKIPRKGNLWVRLGTPISALLQQVGYQYDGRFPVFMGGPMMGFILPNLSAPVTKITNCLLAPDHFEYAEPEPEQACIRCSACSDACPVHLMPQQLYWFARSEDHQKSEQYALQDCIECGLCAYVCPSHIPLIQYFRQEKAKIWEIKEQAQKSHEAKLRFEARQARLEKEEQARKARTQRAAEARREEIAKQNGIDPVQAALARLKAKKQTDNETPNVKTFVDEKGQLQPDNSDIMAQRKARRLARQQAEQERAASENQMQENPQNTNSAENLTVDPKKAAIAAALARAKARKQASIHNAQPENAKANTTENSTQTNSGSAIENRENSTSAQGVIENRENATAIQSAVEKTQENPTALDPKKAAIAAAIARAKAKKQAQNGTPQSSHSTQPLVEEQGTVESEHRESVLENHESSTATQNAVENRESSTVIQSAVEKTQENPTALDPKKAAIAAAIARAKAKKQAQNGTPQSAHATQPLIEEQGAVESEYRQSAIENRENATAIQSAVEKTQENPTALDPKKAAIAAAIARAKAKKQAQNGTAQSAHAMQPLVEEQGAVESEHRESALENHESSTATQNAVENRENATTIQSAVEKTQENPTTLDPKKAAIAAAIARAKAKKQAQNGTAQSAHATLPLVEGQGAVKSEHRESAIENREASTAAQGVIENRENATAIQSAVEKTQENPTALDPKKAAITAAIARAKAKKQAKENQSKEKE